MWTCSFTPRSVGDRQGQRRVGNLGLDRARLLEGCRQPIGERAVPAVLQGRDHRGQVESRPGSFAGRDAPARGWFDIRISSTAI